MKTIEQKAKAYDKALERAIKLKEDPQSVFYEYSPNEGDTICDYIFPELKESEDERIRKALYGWVFVEPDDTFKEGFTKEQILSWIEKQGEHANFINKIQIGDKVTRNEDGVLVNLSQLNRVAKKDEKQGEQKQTVIIPRFRVGDVITSTKNSALKYKIKAVGVLNELGEYDYVVEDVTDTDYKGRIHEMSISKVDEWGVVVEQKPAWSEDDKAVLDALILRLEGDNVYVSPKLAAECLKSLKERVQTQPKQEWSEEDEKMFLDIESLIHSYRTGSYEHELSSWFKSLRPQSTWKPSDKQMTALRQVISGCSYDIEPLADMEKQLKKLREE